MIGFEGVYVRGSGRGRIWPCSGRGSRCRQAGPPASVIQALAGHVHLMPTMSYMYLTPGQKEQSIGLLDNRVEAANEVRGGLVAARSGK